MCRGDCSGQESCIPMATSHRTLPPDQPGTVALSSRGPAGPTRAGRGQRRAPPRPESGPNAAPPSCHRRSDSKAKMPVACPSFHTMASAHAPWSSALSTRSGVGLPGRGGHNLTLIVKATAGGTRAPSTECQQVEAGNMPIDERDRDTLVAHHIDGGWLVPLVHQRSLLYRAPAPRTGATRPRKPVDCSSPRAASQTRQLMAARRPGGRRDATRRPAPARSAHPTRTGPARR
jgi:hypothetical protein